MKNRNILLTAILLVVACFVLCPVARAVGPDTEGNMPGGNNGEGVGVLVNRTTGVWNTGTGFEALNHLTGGNQNTATGVRALFSDTNGGFNTATGVLSLFSNTSGFFNSGTGAYSLAKNTIGSSNTANGYSALYFNTEGFLNTATGFAALYKNTTGSLNTANGYQALYSNATGDGNTAIGSNALFHNTTAGGNTAIGLAALVSNTNGAGNTAIGAYSLNNNIGGGGNTATGSQALQNNTASLNTAYGYQALSHNTSGSVNTALGFAAGSGVTTASGVIAIGTPGFNVNNSCFIGNIYGVMSGFGTAVNINSSGQLFTINSARRFKDDIKPMDRASEVLFALKPVTFRYKKEFDPTGIPQFGLVAEDVEKVNPDLVVRDADGKVRTVRYEQINAMLLNEFLKEHKKVEAQNRRIQEQEEIITELKKEMATVVARLKEQDSKIQRVSDQIELGKAAPQMVVGNW
jgi:trimeric autotransporter adhesin